MLKFHDFVCPKLATNEVVNRAPSDTFALLIEEATMHRNELRREKAEKKARLVKEKKARDKIMRAKLRSLKKAKKNRSVCVQ